MKPSVIRNPPEPGLLKLPCQNSLSEQLKFVVRTLPYPGGHSKNVVFPEKMRFFLLKKNLEIIFLFFIIKSLCDILTFIVFKKTKYFLSINLIYGQKFKALCHLPLPPLRSDYNSPYPTHPRPCIIFDVNCAVPPRFRHPFLTNRSPSDVTNLFKIA